jgi:hypothetical protein
MVSGVRYTVAERGLWTTSALTLMNALIPLRRFARSAGLKNPQELRLYGKAKMRRLTISRQRLDRSRPIRASLYFFRMAKDNDTGCHRVGA